MIENEITEGKIWRIFVFVLVIRLSQHLYVDNSAKDDPSKFTDGNNWNDV